MVSDSTANPRSNRRDILTSALAAGAEGRGPVNVSLRSAELGRDGGGGASGPA